MIIRLSKYEQETIINYNAAETHATIYTADKKVMRKLDTLANDYPDTYNLIKQDEVSQTYSVPKTYISYCKPRTLTDEQRDNARERMQRVNFNNNKRKKQ